MTWTYTDEPYEPYGQLSAAPEPEPPYEPHTVTVECHSINCYWLHGTTTKTVRITRPDQTIDCPHCAHRMW